MPKGRYPWFAMIDGCGASLITDRHVLTSAHCLFGENEAKINRLVLGAHYIYDFFDKQNHEIEKFILHEGFTNMSMMHNDIAIIKLKNPVKFENGLNPICLPNFDETDNMFAYGFGLQNYEGQLGYANYMHEAELDRTNPEKCKEFYGNGPEFNYDYVICAQNDKINTGTCVGDSGGPVSTRKDGQVYQSGIVSFGSSHCNVNGQVTPSASEKVVKHLDWIRKHTQDGQFCEGTHHPFAQSTTNDEP